jgi:hypothetical protein
VLPRPRIRLPLWSVPLIVAALYVARSLIRTSWRLELPMDLVILVMVAVVMVAVARLRAIASAPDDDADTPSERGASRSDAEGPAS